MLNLDKQKNIECILLTGRILYCGDWSLQKINLCAKFATDRSPKIVLYILFATGSLQFTALAFKEEAFRHSEKPLNPPKQKTPTEVSVFLYLYSA